MRKIKVTFCMQQIITGGIEKCLIRILDKMCHFPEYEFNVVVKKHIVDETFIKFFKEKNISVTYFFDINHYIGSKPEAFFRKIVWKLKKFFYSFTQKNKTKICFKNSDIIIDYFNCAFYDELKNINKPKIGWWHCSFDIYNKNLKKNNKRFFTTYDKFVVLTKETHDNLLKNLSSQFDKVVHIYNPIDIIEIREKAKTGIKPETNKPYFVCIGRFNEDKDHDTVIDAITKVKKQISDVLIYFIGDGEKRKEYQNKIKQLGLTDNIIFTGIMDNPYAYIKNAVANILSSPNEGLSTVLIESSCIGTLNISSNCPSCASEILLNSKGGILFPIGDSQKLSEIIINVLNNNINIKQLIDNSSKKLHRFNCNAIIPQIDNLIKECIK